MPSAANPLHKTLSISRGMTRFAGIFRSLLLTLTIGLSACSSPLMGTTSTPTVSVPTSSPVPPTATPPPSAAVVNGEYITLVEFEAELGRYQAAQAALGRTGSAEEARQAVLDELIAQVLLAQAARREGFTLTEADLQSRLDGLRPTRVGVGFRIEVQRPSIWVVI